MAIPAGAELTLKDFCLVATDDLSFDQRLTQLWNEEIIVLAREHDLFADTVTIDAIAGQSVYRVAAPITRILSVAFQNVTLGWTDSGTLGLASPAWESTAPGTPRLWTQNAIPGEVDTPAATVSPRDFLVTPAPLVSEIGAFKLLVITTPETVPIWLEPYLTLRTAGRFCAEAPEIAQPQKAAFYLKVATLWEELIKSRLQA